MSGHEGEGNERQVCHDEVNGHGQGAGFKVSEVEAFDRRHSRIRRHYWGKLRVSNVDRRDVRRSPLEEDLREASSRGAGIEGAPTAHRETVGRARVEGSDELVGRARDVPVVDCLKARVLGDILGRAGNGMTIDSYRATLNELLRMVARSGEAAYDQRAVEARQFSSRRRVLSAF